MISYRIRICWHITLYVCVVQANQLVKMPFNKTEENAITFAATIVAVRWSPHQHTFIVYSRRIFARVPWHLHLNYSWFECVSFYSGSANSHNQAAAVVWICSREIKQRQHANNGNSNMCWYNIPFPVNMWMSRCVRIHDLTSALVICEGGDVFGWWEDVWLGGC